MPMRVAICLKAVPDPNHVEFDLSRNELKKGPWITNSSDLCALEEALRIKETSGCEIVTLSIGPASISNTILKRALALGADRAIGIWDHSLENSDTFLKAIILAQALQKIAPDLIFCGSRSQDMSSEFMGVALGFRLGLPVVTRVVLLEYCGHMEIKAHKKLEKGGREMYSRSLPVVLTVDEGLNRPRYVAPLSKSYRKGLRKNIEFISPEMGDIPDSGFIELIQVSQSKPRTKVGKKMSGLSVQDMMKRLRGESGSKKEILEGHPSEVAKRTVEKIREILA